MKPRNLLRCCVVLEWLFVTATIVISNATEPSLPAPLYAWIQSEAERDLAMTDLLLLGLGVPFLLAVLVAGVGLLCLQRWAAWLYLAATIGGIALLSVTGPQVISASASVVDELASIMPGLILALAFFTDSLKKPVSSVPPPISAA